MFLMVGREFLSMSPMVTTYPCNLTNGELERDTPSLASLLGVASPFILSHFLLENEAYILRLRVRNSFIWIL